MQYLAVTRDIDGESGIVNLQGKDILFLEWSGPVNGVIVHTKNDQFYMPGTLKYWTAALNNGGFTFRIVDRNSAVNVDRIERLDSVFKRAYFDSEIKKDSKCCTMAFKRYKDLEKEFAFYHPGIVIS